MRRRRAERLVPFAPIALALAACGNGDAQTPPPPPRCAAELAGWAEAALAEGPGFNTSSNALLETERPAQHVPAAPLVHLAAGLIVAGGEPFAADAPDLAASLERQLLAMRDASGADDLRLAPHPDTRWSSIAAVGGAAVRAGFDRLHFLVAAKSSLEAPPATGAAIDGGRVFSGCAAAAALAEPTPEGPSRFARAAPAAIEACGCADADRATFRALVWSQLGRRDGVPLAAHVVEIRPRGSPLVLDAETRWADAEPSVARLAGEVYLSAAP